MANETSHSAVPLTYRDKALAERLQIGRSTLWRWVELKKFPQPFRCGRVTLWRSSDVQAWLDNLAS